MYFLISTFFFFIKESKVWWVMVDTTFRSSRLHKFALLFLSLQFTHKFPTALGTKRSEQSTKTISNAYLVLMFSFEVFLAGWPETCFPLELVLWCQPFYCSRFTSSSESEGGGTASSLLLHLVSNLLQLPLFGRCFCCLTTTGSFYTLDSLKQTAAKIWEPISRELQQKQWPTQPPQYNWNKILGPWEKRRLYTTSQGWWLIFGSSCEKVLK